jgi:hypothetical protein
MIKQELWALETDIFDIPGFKEIVRSQNFKNKRITQGCAELFHKVSNIFQGSKKDLNGHEINVSSFDYDNLKKINVYKSPQVAFSFLKETFENISTHFEHDDVVLLGDFNSNFHKIGDPIEKFMDQKFKMKLTSLQKP